MRCLITLALLTTAAIVAQTTVTSTRVESAESVCRDSLSASPPRFTRTDATSEACRDRTMTASTLTSETRTVAEMKHGVAGAVPTSEPTLRPVLDTVPGSAGVPLSFNDPMYANVTDGSSRITLSSGSSLKDMSIVENSGEPTITCRGSCSLTRVRIQSREGVRCVGGNIDLTWVYITATGIGSDHADGLQCYAPGSTGTVTVRNSTFKVAGATTAGYFSADNWQGSHVFENVLFEGGNHGLRIPADGGSSVKLKNVYFVRGSFRYGAFLFDVVNGRRINIAQWENVRWASWQGDQLVLGEQIRRP